MRKLRKYWLIMLLAVLSDKAAAELPWTPTDEEFRLLPRYCWVKMKLPEDAPEKQQWFQSLGKDFVHIHHYCAGMNFANRSQRLPDKEDRLYFRKKAFINYQYMFDHAAPSFALMPDIYMSRGRLYMSGDDAGLALADFKKVLELKKDMAVAYQAMADWYVKFKKTDEALQIVTEGLRQVPGNKGLQKRYAELGGTLPYPEPAPQVAQVDPPAAAEGQKGDAQDGAGQPASAEPVAVSADTQAAPVERKIGNATNPWCRFCPE